MLEPVAQLLILQNTDQRLDEVIQALRALPEEKNSCEQALINADRKLASIYSKSQEIEKEIKKIEGLIDLKRTQIGRYRIQQMETRKNDEYAAFNKEIGLAQEVITQWEDQQLGLMEQSDVWNCCDTKALSFRCLIFFRISKHARMPRPIRTTVQITKTTML